MAQSNDNGRSDPSFGGDKELDLAGDSDSSVNFDELFAEIDKSVAGSFTPAAEPTAAPAEERWVEDLAAVPPELEDDIVELGSLPPAMEAAQPPLDFGAVEEDHFTPSSAAAAPQPKTTAASSSGEESMSRGVLMAGGALAALGILLGAAGMYVGLSASSQIEALQQSVDALQTKLATTQVSGDPRVGQLQAEQAGIVSRLDEMTAKLDALASTPQKREDEPRLAELNKRLDALEHKAATAKAPAAVAPAKASAPAPAKAAASAKPAVSGNWTVILASYASQGQAEEMKGKVQKQGYPADVVKTLVDGKAWYRLRILGFASHEAAKAAIPSIESKTGITGGWAAMR